MNPYIKFKHPKDIQLFNYLNPVLLDVIEKLSFWCEARELPFRITCTISTLEEDKALKRVSDSHRTRRAVDLSLHEWPEEKINSFQTIFNAKYKDKASISKSDGIPRLIVVHGVGENRHFHVALHSKYSMADQKTTVK